MSEKTKSSAARWTNNTFFIALVWVISHEHGFWEFFLILAGCAVFAFIAGCVRGFAGILTDEK
jgi:hypothetical protein